MFKFTNIVMMFAPLVWAPRSLTVGHMGLHPDKSLQDAGDALRGLVRVYRLVLLPVALLARVPLRAFVKAVAGPFRSRLQQRAPRLRCRAMEQMEGLGVPRQIVPS